MNAKELRQRAAQMQDIYHAMVETFGEAMLEQLVSHEQKGNFFTWRPAPCDLRKYIDTTLKDLQQATNDGNKQRIKELSADLANYALKYAQVHGPSV